jgi:GAF domain-containing protein
MRRQAKRFALAQESLVDVLITSKDDFMEVLVKIREQFLSLLDAEHCVLSFEANRSVLEFDGRCIYPSTRAKRGLLRTAMGNGEPLHLCSPPLEGQSSAPSLEGLPHAIAEVRSYVCLPLVDSEGNVQAVAEVFNSRHDSKVVGSWLQAGDRGSLHVLRNFVGNLIKAFTKRANLGDLVSPSTTMPPAREGNATTRRPSLASTPEMNEYPLEWLVDFLRNSVGIETCCVFAYDKDADLLWARLSDCNSCPQTVRCDEGIIGLAARGGETVHYTRDTQDETQFEQLFRNISLSHCQVHEALCVPTVNAHQKLNGVVLLLNKKTRALLTPADLAMCANLCRHIGNALHSSELHEAILKAQGKAQTLLDLSAVLFRELETNALLVAIMDAIKKPMNATKCCVFLMDDDKHELVAPVGSQIACDLSQEVIRLPVSEGIVGAAARQGEIINVRDVSCDGRFNATIDKQTGFVTRSILAVPIKDATGDVLGVLEMVNKLSKQYFDKDDEELARGIAYYLAIALKNAKLFESARAAMRRSDALLAMMQVISSSNENVGDVFRALVDTACQILNVEHGALFFVDALTKTLFCRVGGNWKGYTIPLGKFIPGVVAQSREALIVGRDAQNHADFDAAYDALVGVRTKSLLCVPIQSATSRSVVAVFYAANKLTSKANGFCDEDLTLMRSICTEMASVIERRAWELVFLVESQGEASSDATTEVMSSFLSQYTTTPTLNRRRSSSLGQVNSRAPTPVQAAAPSPMISDDTDASFAVTTTTTNTATVGISNGLLSRVFAGGASAVNAASSSLSLICRWDLNPWELTMLQLVDLVVDMFAYFDLPHRFQIQCATLRRFAVSVKGQYHDIPYHNFYHAFTTLHVSFLMVRAQSSLDSLVATTYRTSHLPQAETDSDSTPHALLEARDLLAVFVAAFCHDMNHNGRTNDFHIRYRTSLAMLYNDQSVLENMHAAACFETMRRPGHDILAHVGASEYRQVRKAIIRAILATDMHNHAAIVTQLHEKLQVDVFNSDDEAHKELLLNAIVHAADISGPALARPLHVKWSLQLLEEFNLQYHDETALGLAPTPYMNARPDSAELGKLNLAFIDSCVFPLWRILHTFLEGLDACLANVQSNRSVWTTMISDAEAAANAHSVQQVDALEREDEV